MENFKKRTADEVRASLDELQSQNEENGFKEIGRRAAEALGKVDKSEETDEDKISKQESFDLQKALNNSEGKEKLKHVTQEIDERLEVLKKIRDKECSPQEQNDIEDSIDGFTAKKQKIEDLGREMDAAEKENNEVRYNKLEKERKKLQAEIKFAAKKQKIQKNIENNRLLAEENGFKEMNRRAAEALGKDESDGYEDFQEKVDNKLKEAEGESKSTSEQNNNKSFENDKLIEEVRRAFEELESIRSNPYSTPSMVFREEQKVKELIREGKIGAMEAHFLEKKMKKGFFEQTTGKQLNETKLGVYGEMVVQKGMKFYNNSWYGKLSKWMNKGDNKWQKFGKRVLVSTAIGTGAIALGGASLTAAGLGALAVYSAGRVAASLGAAAGAGEIHRWATKGKVNRKLEYWKGKRDSEYQTRKERLLASGERLDASEIKSLRELRKKEIDNNISSEELAEKQILENKYKKYKQYMDRSHDLYKEGVHEIRSTNDKHRMYVSAAAAIATGYGMAKFGILGEALEAVDGIDSGADQIETNPSKTTPDSVKEVIVEGPKNPTLLEQITNGEHQPPQSSYIGRGEGITHAYLRQLQESSELREAFGIEGTPTASDAARLAAEHGYINSDGSDIRVFDGHNAAYDLEVVNGKVEVFEYKDGQLCACSNAELVEKHGLNSDFEGTKHEEYEYIHKNKEPDFKSESTFIDDKFVVKEVSEEPFVNQRDQIVETSIPKNTPEPLDRYEGEPMITTNHEDVISLEEEPATYEQQEINEDHSEIEPKPEPESEPTRDKNWRRNERLKARLERQRLRAARGGHSFLGSLWRGVVKTAVNTGVGGFMGTKGVNLAGGLDVNIHNSGIEQITNTTGGESIDYIKPKS